MRAVRLGNLLEYRCHIGYRMGLQTMIAEKTRLGEHALEVALSQSEELSALLQTALDRSEHESSESLHQEIAKRQDEQRALRTLSGNKKGEQASD